MNFIETILGNLSGGELQRLALLLLSYENRNWKEFASFGGCEGGNRTRKGTPDIWAKNELENLVYIQATCDSAKGKLLSDTEKSIKKLVENKNHQGAICVGFTSFDPNDEEISNCEKLCTVNECEFVLYNNYKIAKLINEKYQHLKVMWDNEEFADELNRIELCVDDFRVKIEFIILNTQWGNRPYSKLLLLTLKELTKNSFEHGNASRVVITLSSTRINIKDNGFKFNLIDFQGEARNYGGGKKTLEFLVQQGEIYNISYNYVDKYNWYQFNVKTEYNKDSSPLLEVDNSCSLNLYNLFGRSSNIEISVPEHCDEINIKISADYMMLSDFAITLERICRQLCKYKHIYLDTSNLEDFYLVVIYDIQSRYLNLVIKE